VAARPRVYPSAAPAGDLRIGRSHRLRRGRAAVERDQLRCRAALRALPDRASATAAGPGQLAASTRGLCVHHSGRGLPLSAQQSAHHATAVEPGGGAISSQSEMPTPDTPRVLLEHHLKALRLPTILREYDKVARQCAQEKADFPTYLLRLTELELLDRDRRATERRMRQARFPVVKSLDSFDSSPSHPRTKPWFWSWPAASSWSGTTAPALVSELIEARDEKQLQRFQKQLAAYDLLIVDELGFVPPSKTGAELLFEIFSRRYERASVLVIGNLPFDEWTEIFGSERLTGTLLDRLTHHVHILKMNRDSYRLKQSRRKRNPSPDRWTLPSERASGDKDLFRYTPEPFLPRKNYPTWVFSLANYSSAPLVPFCNALDCALN
jgi:DNA replication protein DnaC